MGLPITQGSPPKSWAAELSGAAAQEKKKRKLDSGAVAFLAGRGHSERRREGGSTINDFHPSSMSRTDFNVDFAASFFSVTMRK